jgi:hypothetical protein
MNLMITDEPVLIDVADRGQTEMATRRSAEEVEQVVQQSGQADCPNESFPSRADSS